MVQNKTEKQSKKWVYYTGTDTVAQGYALCYNRDSTNTAVDLSTTGNSAATSNPVRALQVEKPATANLSWFAGCIAEGDPGSAGPRWLQIVQPTGALVDVYANISCTLDTTKLAVQNASYALGTASASTLTVGKAFQTIDRSSTNGLVLAQLDGVRVYEVDPASVVSFTAATLVAPTGGTTGGTWALENVDSTGYSVGSVSDIENNFHKLVSRVNSIDTALNSVISNLKTANLMASA